MPSHPNPTEPAPGFTAYEYSSVRAPRDLEPLYQDTYRSFGWSVEVAELSEPVRALPSPSGARSTVTLKLKRDRNIRNRQMVQTLQRKAESSLATITRLEKSKSAWALAAALTVGILGCGFLAGSVFAIDGGLMVLSIVLGAVGLLGWLAGFLSYLGVKNRRTSTVTPLIDREFDVLFEASAQATRLLQ